MYLSFISIKLGKAVEVGVLTITALHIWDTHLNQVDMIYDIENISQMLWYKMHFWQE